MKTILTLAAAAALIALAACSEKKADNAAASYETTTNGAVEAQSDPGIPINSTDPGPGGAGGATKH